MEGLNVDRELASMCKGFDEFEKLMDDIGSKITEAVSNVLKDVTVPRQSDMNDIIIPMLEVTQKGQQGKTYVIGKVRLNCSFNIETPIEIVSEQHNRIRPLRL